MEVRSGGLKRWVEIRPQVAGGGDGRSRPGAADGGQETDYPMDAEG